VKNLKSLKPDQLLEVMRENRVAMMVAPTLKERKLAWRRRNAAFRQYHIAITVRNP
jgi:hypothetical protein